MDPTVKQTGAAKSEAWFIARAGEGASLLVGHYPGLDPATLRDALDPRLRM